jgi:hypothetical protein
MKKPWEVEIRLRVQSAAKSAGRYLKFLLSCSACGLLLRLGIGMIASHGLWYGIEAILTALWFARCALRSDFGSGNARPNIGSVKSVQSVAKKSGLKIRV